MGRSQSSTILAQNCERCSPSHLRSSSGTLGSSASLSSMPGMKGILTASRDLSPWQTQTSTCSRLESAAVGAACCRWTWLLPPGETHVKHCRCHPGEVMYPELGRLPHRAPSRAFPGSCLVKRHMTLAQHLSRRSRDASGSLILQRGAGLIQGCRAAILLLL